MKVNFVKSWHIFPTETFFKRVEKFQCVSHYVVSNVRTRATRLTRKMDSSYLLVTWSTIPGIQGIPLTVNSITNVQESRNAIFLSEIIYRIN